MEGSSTLALPKNQDPHVKPKKQLTIKELRKYPVEDRKVELPESTSQGKVQVAADRDGPFAMCYRIYGSGAAKLLVRPRSRTGGCAAFTLDL